MADTASNAYEVDQVQLVECLSRCLEARQVPFVKGAPGIGKSDIIRQVAEKYELKVIDLRLAQCDPTDLQGFPVPRGEKMDYVPPAHFPLAGEEIPAGFKGWLLFLDEYSTAPPSVQAASYKVILDRCVGIHPLHKNVAIVAAGNRETDKAVVYKMSTASQSRLIHYTLKVSYEFWLDWAMTHDIDHRIRAYIKWKPVNLHKFDPNHANDTFPCPRTWEFVHTLIVGRKELDKIDLANIAGAIGQGTGREFRTFSQIYKKLPTFEEILKNPKGIAIPDKPDVLHALASLISHPDNVKHIENAIEFLERMPIEFQVWTLRDVIRKSPDAINLPKVNEWKQRNAHRMT